MWRRRPSTLLAASALLALMAAGCRQDMHDQPRYDPMEASAFFADGRAVRPLVEGTVARGTLREDAHLYTGLINGQPAETFPFPITRHRLERGQERYEIFCAPCHGRLGDGRGMVVQRGFPAPRSYHEEEMRQQPPGYYFDVMTRGFGRMQDYAALVSPEDRWAIAAYIRALQLSQRAPAAVLTADDQRRLKGAPAGTGAGAGAEPHP